MNPAVGRVLLRCAPAAVLLGMAGSPAAAQTCGPPDFRVSRSGPERPSFSARASPEFRAEEAKASGKSRAQPGAHRGLSERFGEDAADVATLAGTVLAAAFLDRPGNGVGHAYGARGKQRGKKKRKHHKPPHSPSTLDPEEPSAGTDPPGKGIPLVPLLPVVPVLPEVVVLPPQPAGPGNAGSAGSPGSGGSRHAGLPGSGGGGGAGFSGPTSVNPEPGAALLFLSGLLALGLVRGRRPL